MNWRYRFAAWLTGGTLSNFEGRDEKGKWHKGLMIVSPAAMDAHRAAFRKDANVYVDTAITDPFET